jgi:ferric-dicitrate binding protein FerR (iron transport regulator)
LKPDPRWSRALEQALPSEPRSGAEERVLRGVRARVARAAGSSQRQPRLSAQGSARRWLLALAAAGACALLALFALRQHGTPLPIGSEQVARAASAQASGAVDTGTGERTLTLGDGVRVLLRAGTRLRWQERDDGSECWLDQGGLLLNVPEGYGRRFRVHTSSTEVEVTGTVFGVEERGTRSSVTVWHGSVRVTRAAEQARVVAGQHWPRGAPSLAASPTDLARIGALERVTDASLAAAPDAGVLRASDERAPPSVPAARLPAPPPAPRPTLAQLVERYREARQLEARGERGRAADLYAMVGASTGAEAEAATFAAARLRHGLGQHEASRRLLEAYKNRFPNGSYARAVDVLLLRVQLARGDNAAVERVATQFLNEHASDPRAAQFRWARAKARADSGRCAEALADAAALDAAQAAELRKVCGE